MPESPLLGKYAEQAKREQDEELETVHDDQSSHDGAEPSGPAEGEARESSPENASQPSAAVPSRGLNQGQAVLGKTTPKNPRAAMKKKKKPLPVGPTAPRPNFAVKKNSPPKDKPVDGKSVLIVLDQLSNNGDYLH